jgi:site-specific DNA recombinase
VDEAHIYTDREISGSVDQGRSGYQSLLAAAKARRFDAVIVEGQDRLWRDQEEMHAALKRFRYCGVRVFSMATGTDLTDKTGKLIASVMGWKDEEFLDDSRDKVRRGMEGRVLKGFSPGGRTYGYRSKPIYEPSGGRDAYGSPLVMGYQKVIDQGEAEIVNQIFQRYANGASSKAIAMRLNADHVPPPRPKKDKVAQGWTWTTVAGHQKRGTGILNNEIYLGRLIWNRSQKLQNPDTERKVPKYHSRDTWVVVDVPDLQIVAQELWDRVKARQTEASHRANGRAGGYPGQHAKCLLSGLLRCGICGAHYIVRDRKKYGCSYHMNRGPEVCRNHLAVSREHLENVLLDALQQQLFSREAVTYLTKKVNTLLRQRSEDQAALQGAQLKSHHHELSDAEATLENIRKAIKAGIITPTTKQLLEEAEARLEALRTSLVTPHPTVKTGSALSVLPSAVERYLLDLRKTLHRDLPKARAMLRLLVDEVRLVPQDIDTTEPGLTAQICGNIQGVFSLLPAASTTGAGSPTPSLAHAVDDIAVA